MPAKRARRPSRRRRRAPNVDALLRRKRRRFASRLTAVLVALIVLVLVDRGGFLLSGRGDLGRYDGGTFLVTRVIDGDTFDVAAPDFTRAQREDLAVPPPTTRVRVWGVDTPELARPTDPRRPDIQPTPAEPFADEAAALATRWLTGQAVTLRLERTRPRGRFGRLVAHVELPDGGLLAERLILAGLARADDRWPHRHAERFALLEQQARRDRVGLWSLPRDPYAPFADAPPPAPASHPENGGG
ncbi:MAG: thermonuclease family protein [Planctomycetota bacterium]